jgi:hypothetical protein
MEQGGEVGGPVMARAVGVSVVSIE